MKIINTLALGAILTFTAGFANAAPRGKAIEIDYRQDEHRKDDHRGDKNKDREPPRREHHQSTETKAQIRLRELGYYHGAIDGDFGRQSTRALVRYQRDKHLPVSARLDTRTLRSLRIL